ncbi:hypothetical protein [Bradyrhizobium diazoefficiens]|uniref:hypothetical protein n=1 Tax=Bradyrhizobium diazoefficiens TaxID=1355477 RepID=UPI000D73430E|nr:hypothetical protein [Bradyrhizobium diazoefficiens]AWO92417.1 hypothetical protein DI395_30605 [Bradyrhizobium diazoefficiens]
MSTSLKGGAMSPAAMRRYCVSFVNWESYETYVLAPDERTAVAKAAAMYTLNGLTDFTCTITDTADWKAELADEQVQS